MSTTTTGCPALDRYVAEVREACTRSASTEDTVRAITAANERLGTADDFCLPEGLRQIAPGVPYTRNLVHQDPENKFSIIAIVWGSFQATRVHDHLNWCVVQMLEGRCLATEYDRLDDESVKGQAELAIRKTELIDKGGICALLPPPRTNIHKMENATGRTAISLHTYGDPGTKARVFEPATGQVEIVDLLFHNT